MLDSELEVNIYTYSYVVSFLVRIKAMHGITLVPICYIDMPLVRKKDL